MHLTASRNRYRIYTVNDNDDDGNNDNSNNIFIIITYILFVVVVVVVRSNNTRMRSILDVVADRQWRFIVFSAQKSKTNYYYYYVTDWTCRYVFFFTCFNARRNVTLRNVVGNQYGSGYLTYILLLYVRTLLRLIMFLIGSLILRKLIKLPIGYSVLLFYALPADGVHACISI